MHGSRISINNREQPCASMSTLRRASRPININLPMTNLHSDPGIYSAPISSIGSNERAPTYSNPSSTVVYQTNSPNRVPSDRDSAMNNQVNIYSDMQMPSSFAEPHRTPRTFPLQVSPNHYQQFFQFPPVVLTNNTSSQSIAQSGSVPTSWSNPVLNPLMIKRMNETDGTIVDDDEDPTGLIQALVNSDDSNSTDLINSVTDSSINRVNRSGSDGLRTTSPSSHILTTPPNPLASNDHPDNQMHVTTSHLSQQSPLRSAGFEIAIKSQSPGTSTILPPRNQADSFTFIYDPSVIDSNGTHTSQVYRNPRDRSSPLQDVRYLNDNSNSSSIPTQSNSSGFQTPPMPTSFASVRLATTSESPQNSAKSSSYSCNHPGCRRTFSNKSALSKHNLTHTEDRKHVCSQCGRSFKRADHLRGHEHTHQAKKPHACLVSTCNKSFNDNRSLKRHIEKDHQDILETLFHQPEHEWRMFLPPCSTVTVKQEPDADSDMATSSASLDQKHRIYTYEEKKTVKCIHCSKAFKCAAALNGHMRLHGGFSDIPAKPSVEKSNGKKKRATEDNDSNKKKKKKVVSIDSNPTEIPNNSSNSSIKSMTDSSGSPDQNVLGQIKEEKLHYGEPDSCAKGQLRNGLMGAGPFPDRHPSTEIPIQPSNSNPTPVSTDRSDPDVDTLQRMVNINIGSTPGSDGSKRTSTGSRMQPSPPSSSADEAPYKSGESTAVLEKRTGVNNNHGASELIGTPSATSDNSSASSVSSTKRFDYTQSARPKLFHSKSVASESLDPAGSAIGLDPNVPYTPPPMLGRDPKGRTFFYRQYSQPNASTEPLALEGPSAPIVTQIPEESTKAKINIGQQYQAEIPDLQIRPCQQYKCDDGDQLLFSASELSAVDEKCLEKYEFLLRKHPFLFSSRQNPASYPLELFYMLLYEYKGDLPRTFKALLTGQVDDIKSCRPLIGHHFANCDRWSSEEIEKFKKYLKPRKNDFLQISRMIGTKSIKQCIEYYYMTKMSIQRSTRVSKGEKSPIMTRRKRLELMNDSINRQGTFGTDESSLSSVNDYRSDGFDNSREPRYSQKNHTVVLTTDQPLRVHQKQHRPRKSHSSIKSKKQKT